MIYKPTFYLNIYYNSLVYDPVFLLKVSICFLQLLNQYFIVLDISMSCKKSLYTDSMFNISKTFKKKTNIIERKKEANTLKAVWIFYCLKANRCGLTNILNLYLLNSCCYMLYSCPCRYYIEKKIWVWLEIKIRDRSRSVPLYLEQVSGQIFYLGHVFPPKCQTNSIS